MHYKSHWKFNHNWCTFFKENYKLLDVYNYFKFYYVLQIFVGWQPLWNLTGPFLRWKHGIIDTCATFYSIKNALDNNLIITNVVPNQLICLLIFIYFHDILIVLINVNVIARITDRNDTNEFRNLLAVQPKPKHFWRICHPFCCSRNTFLPHWLLNNNFGKFIDDFWLKIDIAPSADYLVCVAIGCS